MNFLQAAIRAVVAAKKFFKKSPNALHIDEVDVGSKNGISEKAATMRKGIIKPIPFVGNSKQFYYRGVKMALQYENVYDLKCVSLVCVTMAAHQATFLSSRTFWGKQTKCRGRFESVTFLLL